MSRLLNQKRNVYSQTGEDGVIEEILKTLPVTDKWCVELGAWDGLYLTNTRNLIETQGYSAVLIEADKSRFKVLESNYAHNRNVITLNNFVGFEQKDNLDRILTDTPIPLDFDLLSIDIDGNDYHVWKAITKYKPKAVIIEYNPTIPTHIRFVQKACHHINQGSSLLSLIELGKEKGYELVSVLPINAFFVKKEYFPAFEIESNAPEILRTNLDQITYLFSGYDGTIFLDGNKKLPWHNIELKPQKFQYLPRILRSYPGNFSTFRKLVFLIYLSIEDTDRFIKIIKKGTRALVQMTFGK